MANEMIDEDDKWLYGDCNQEEDQGKDENSSLTPNLETSKNVDLQPPEIRTEDENSIQKDTEAAKDDNTNDDEAGQESSENKDQKENGEIDDDKDEEDDEEEDDSDEDNVNVIIGDINKTAPTYTNLNIPKRGPNISGPGVKTAGKFSIEDFESVGIINGVPAHEFNVDVIEDKPWRMPGADITDYFNYGFNEETWKAYCERQKRIRIHESCTGLPTQALASQAWTGTPSSQSTQYASAPIVGGRKQGWEAGQIRVIGAGVASRRVDEAGNDTAGGIPPTNMMPPMIPPPMEVPPPGFSSSGDHFSGPPSSGEYFNPEPDYFSSYEPTAADQWRDNWAPGNLVTFGQNVKSVHSHLDDSRDKRDRSSDRDRDRNLDRDRRDRSHRNRSRSKSHERKRKSRSRSRSRSRSPSHKKHKKKSKKSDKKKRDDDE